MRIQMAHMDGQMVRMVVQKIEIKTPMAQLEDSVHRMVRFMV